MTISKKISCLKMRLPALTTLRAAATADINPKERELYKISEKINKRRADSFDERIVRLAFYVLRCVHDAWRRQEVLTNAIAV